VVVEAGERSGSLITANIAQDLGRDVCAVPGPVTSSLAAGTNALLYDGAPLVRSAQDVLDRLFGAGIVVAVSRERERLPAELAGLLESVRAGRDTVARLAAADTPAPTVLARLAELELRGHVRRGPGGRYLVTAE